ncbi:putative ABC exporter domain-containing protein [Eubacteriales bacterium OttesenSCG-928-N13]|nr:putative ABC exporter domain-containing protein [Eubacteriales bacterium OttesenSCG-928-N13]
MRSIGYLLLTSLKNTIKQLRESPAKLIMVIAVIGFMGFLIVLGGMDGTDSFLHLDMNYLKAGYFALLMLFLVMAVMKGLNSGDTFFEMNDVNMLFVSPVSPRLILGYGLIRALKTAFWGGFFLLFQYNNIARLFDINYGSMWLMLGGYMLVIVVCQMISLLLYSTTNGRPKRKRAVKIGMVILCLPLVLQLVVPFLQHGNLLGTLNAFAYSPLLDWFPIAGWGAGGVTHLLMGNYGMALLLLALIPIAILVLARVVLSANVDYYEDVLVATETMAEKKHAAQQGSMNTDDSRKKRPIVARSGDIWGHGARALLGRHLREMRRENPLLLSWHSWLVIAGAALIGLFARGELGMEFIFMILMWMQVFLVGTGRGLKETYKHYLYMIPASSTSKLVWSNMELVFRTFIEGLLIFPICGLIMGDGLGLIALCVICYTLFTMLLIAINLLSMRFTGANLSSGLMLIYYFIGVILVMVPGLVPAIMVGVQFGSLLWPLAILSAWSLIAALGCFALSRGVLNKCDMPVMEARK